MTEAGSVEMTRGKCVVERTRRSAPVEMTEVDCALRKMTGEVSKKRSPEDSVSLFSRQ